MHGIHNDVGFAMIGRMCEHHEAFQRFIASYHDQSASEVEITLIKIAYGARQNVDVPFLRLFAAQVGEAAAKLLSEDKELCWVNSFYGNLSDTKFSQSL